MALPELLLPPAIPAFLAEGHAIELLPAHADVPMRTGHARRRRIWSSPPRIVDVGLRLTDEAMLALHEWFEGPLEIGARSFAAAVANQGSGLLYWEARFEEAYEAVALESGWRVSARLRLFGEGSATPPAFGSMQADSTVAFLGAAAITIPQTLEGHSVIALLVSSASMDAATLIELTSVINGAPANDTDFEIRWSWMRLPLAPGADYAIEASEEATARNWLGF